MAVCGGVCPAILPADRQLLLRAAQRREHSDRRWQIRHASGKALAARDKEPAPNPWLLSHRPSHAYGGKPKSATLSLSFPRARESSIGKGFIRKGDPPPPDCHAIQVRLPFTKLARAIREKIQQRL